MENKFDFRLRKRNKELLTRQEVEKIIILLYKNNSDKMIRRIFNISFSTLLMIKRGQLYF
jgi:hypothetical protein